MSSSIAATPEDEPPRRTEEEALPAPAERPQSRLHSFSFPTLNWGSQRVLRCVKLGDEAGEVATRYPPPASKRPSSSSSPEKDEPSPAADARPWNLRTRRAACYAPKEPALKQQRHPSPHNSSPSSALRLRSEVKGERRKFSIQLSREEIEADFIAMKGTKPPRRPKKRARIVQRQLDSLFPGLWLCDTEITPDTYKVED